MKARTVIVLAMVVMVGAGCLFGENDAPAVMRTDGEQVMLFPEWRESGSAYERSLSTNLFAVYTSRKWVVRHIKDGALVPYWKGDTRYSSIKDAKSVFGISVDFQITCALYDAFLGTGSASVDEQRPTKPPEGWVIVSSGEEFSFKFPGGYVSPMRTYATRQEAVNAAWGQQEYQKKIDARKAREWKEIE